MAIVKFAKCKKTQTVGGLHGAITYCCRPAKVAYQGRDLISGVNCVPQAALLEFMNTKRQYGSTDGRMYYHMVQSFRPDDPVTPEMAHEIALKLAEYGADVAVNYSGSKAAAEETADTVSRWSVYDDALAENSLDITIPEFVTETDVVIESAYYTRVGHLITYVVTIRTTSTIPASTGPTIILSSIRFDSASSPTK